MALKNAQGGARSQSSKKKKISKAVVFLAVVAIVLFLSGGMLAYGYTQELKVIEQMQAVVDVDTIYPGITVGGIDVSGLTYEQAHDTVMAYDAEKLALYTAAITVGDREWRENLPSSSNAKEALDKAWQYARIGDLESRYQAVTALAENPMDYPIEYKTDASRLPVLVNAIAEELDYPAVDAEVLDFDRDTKVFLVSEDSDGRALDRESLLSAINTSVDNGWYPIEVEGTLEVVEPRATKDQLSGRNRLLSSFTTETTGDSARNSNIRLCSEAFNGSVVMPGEEFSLNEKTGLRSKATGYQEAGAIKNGKLIPEPGGGVCQVSTTLFNAIVRTGVDITERNNHSYPISYIEKGMDAMINYPNLDFKFVNTTESPMYILTTFEDRKLTVEVYGEPLLEDGVTIELRAETTATIEPGATEYVYDSTLIQGYEEEERSARTGYRVTTYIQYYRGDTMIEERELFKSSYTAFSRIVRVGTMVNNYIYDPSLPVL